MKRVLTVGVFDYFHIGHLNLFERARALGDYLVAAVQDDAAILKYKPNADVMYSTDDRCRLVSALRVVDEVVLYEDVDVDIKKFNFDVFAVGGDQKHAGFQRAIDWCKANGKQVVRLGRTEGICSSDIKRSIERDD